MNSKKTVIELNNIYKIYRMGDTEVKACNGINLNIYEGEFVTIMGPSGSGKSTLMNIIGCLDPPSDGNYILDGEEVSKMSDDELAKVRNQKIGFIFQKFQLLPGLSSKENVELPMIYAGVRTPERNKISFKFLSSVGLLDRANHNPNELSGGQMQRVAIARSLVNYPSIILADEPTGNLDSKSGKEIMDIFQELHKKGRTIILITHNIEMAEYGDRVISLRDGMIVSDEKIKQKEQTVSDIAFSRQSTGALPFNGGHMTLLQSFKIAWNALKTNKLRSLLTMLGIIIGVSAVIVMTSIGEGTKSYITTQISSLGSNLIFVTEGSRENVVQGTIDSSYRKLTLTDVEFIKEKCRLITGVSPQLSKTVTVRYLYNNMTTSLIGSTEEFFHIRNYPVSRGRIFTEEEASSRASVCLVGSYVVEKLFGENINPVGETIKISRGTSNADGPGIRLTVIGVLEEKGESFGRDNDNQIIAPFDTVKYRVFYEKYIQFIFLEALESDYIDEAVSEVETVLAPLHDNNPENIQVSSQEEILARVQSTLGAFTFMLAGIACISLFVGGIGIMNIMLVSVTERTREIGLRKAIGATGSDILFQFLVEALVLSLSGGILGIILGISLSKIYSLITAVSSIQMLSRTFVSFDSILLSFSFSAMVGIFFGIYPARKASQLNPIDALRYE